MDTRQLTLYQQELFDKIIKQIDSADISQVKKGLLKNTFQKLIESVIIDLEQNQIEIVSLRETINDIICNS